MFKRRLLLVLSLATFCLSAAPAMADLALLFDIDGTEMTYSSGTATISLQSGATLMTKLMDGIVTNDTANIDNGDGDSDTFLLTATLNFTNEPGVDDWSASGSIQIMDLSGINVIDAYFQSSDIPFTFSSDDVYLTPGPTPGTAFLNIDGYLSPNTAPAILVDPTPASNWTFQGEASASNGSDGVPDQITVQNWQQWDAGTVISFHYVIFQNSLDTLFASDFTGVNGDIDLTITSTPVPAAVLLGIIGLGIAGLKLRKYA